VTAFGVAHPERVMSMILYWPAGGAKYRLSSQQRFAVHLAFVQEWGLEKVVALALESGRANAQTKFNDPGYFEEYGRKITNDNGERFSGTFDLTYALTHSINSVFARLGSEIWMLIDVWRRS